MLQLGHWVAGKGSTDWPFETWVQQVQQRGVEGVKTPFEGEPQMHIVALMLAMDSAQSLSCSGMSLYTTRGQSTLHIIREFCQALCLENVIKRTYSTELQPGQLACSG